MKKQTQQGFTLIELMIVIAIVGILAALALPAYQQYTVRAKIGEALSYAAEAKTSIAEHFATKGELPTDNDTAGIPSNVDTDIVDSVVIDEGIITLEVKGDLASDVDTANQFVLSAITDGATRRITWICKTGTTAASALKAKYLPSSCR